MAGTSALRSRGLRACGCKINAHAQRTPRSPVDERKSVPGSPMNLPSSGESDEGTGFPSCFTRMVCPMSSARAMIGGSRPFGEECEWISKVGTTSM